MFQVSLAAEGVCQALPSHIHSASRIGHMSPYHELPSHCLLKQILFISKVLKLMDCEEAPFSEATILNIFQKGKLYFSLQYILENENTNSVSKIHSTKEVLQKALKEKTQKLYSAEMDYIPTDNNICSLRLSCRVELITVVFSTSVARGKSGLAE